MRMEVQSPPHHYRNNNNNNTNLSNVATRIKNCKKRKNICKATGYIHTTTILFALFAITNIMNTSFCSSLLRIQIQLPFVVKCEAFILNNPTIKKSFSSRSACTSTMNSGHQSCTTYHTRYTYQFHRSRLLSSKAEDETTLNTPPTTSPTTPNNENQTQEQAVHKAEGLCAVYKPTNWTSQDVVSYIRGMLERDARQRGIILAKRRNRRSKKKIKVGHGGTLDPLAEGVLVLGIGPTGTKSLTKYLSGSKEYVAKGKFGFETNTLDMEGNVTKTASYDHISHGDVEGSLDKFRGKIMQVPPLFSAIRKNGKRLYEQAREGKVEEDIVIDPREVEIYKLDYVQENVGNDGDSSGGDQVGENRGLPSFGLTVQCGGGTYIRSLIRDIGYEVGSVATMTNLIRTKQGPFTLDNAMPKDEWSADTIYAAVEKFNAQLSSDDDNAGAGGKEYDSDVAS